MSKIFFWFFIILLVSLLALFIYQGYRFNSIYFTYHGFDVRKVQDNGVSYKIEFTLPNNPQPYIISVRNDPRELESIPVEENLKEKVIKKELFITMEPEPVSTGVTIIASLELARITGAQELFNLPTTGALFRPVEGKNVTLKTCADTSQQTAIVYLKPGNATQIYSENDCVIIEGTDEYELIKGADRLALTLLGIMKE